MSDDRQRKGAALIGGCFCGAIRYEAKGTPFHETSCHCTICRRTTGAPFVAWFSVRPNDLRFTRGLPARFNSTERGRRSFCPRCGTQLTFESADLPDEVDITTASLDDPSLAAPHDNTRTSSRLGWIAPDGLPEFLENRQAGRGAVAPSLRSWRNLSG